MKIQKSQIVTAFREARNLRDTMDAYCIHPGGTHTSLDVVTEAVRQTCNKPVKIYRLPFPSPRLRGIFLPYKDKFVVLVDSDLPPFGDRYVATKEMGHIVLIKPDNVTNDPGEMIEWMLKDGLDLLENDVAPANAANEKLAKIIAFEILIPPDERGKARKMLDADPDNLFKLSEMYQLPKHVVETVLGDRYLEFCNRFYLEV